MSSKNRNAAEILHAFTPLTDEQIRDGFDTGKNRAPPVTGRCS